jgi:hypothetical protein
MGHAHHFLSRLDRVCSDHVELALSLYNHPDTLRFILSHARLPEHAERIAISLSEGERGPFLIVTREGHFVTCLGEGMSRGCLPVIDRRRFDALHTRAIDHKAMVDAQMKLCPDERSSERLIDRIFKAGDHLTREEFLALGAMQPLLWGTLYNLNRLAIDTFNTAAQVLKNVRTIRGPFHAMLHDLRDTFWAMKHLTLLLSLDAPREHLERQSDAFLAATRVSHGSFLTLSGITSTTFVGAWATARYGDLYLPLLTYNYEHAHTPGNLFADMLELMAIAAVHPELRVSARDALCCTGSDVPSRAALDPMRIEHRKRFDAILDHPESLDIDAARFGAKLLVEHYKHPLARDEGWTTPEDVPVDVARSFLVNLRWDCIEHPTARAHLTSHVASVARMRPEEFYLPTRYASRLREPWPLEDVLAYMHRWIGRFTRPAPVRVAINVGRNDPCPCGSEKKYKRCCALLPANDTHGAPKERPPSIAEVLGRAVA